MNDKPELELLIEIAKLLRKYGPETFENLAEQLSAPEFSERIISVLSTTARAARTARTNGAQTLKGERHLINFRSSLVDLERTDPNKSALLIKFYDGLVARALLPTLRDVRSFASDTGLPPLKATTRDKAIVPLVKALLPLPVEELKARLSAVKPVTMENDRSLEGWSRIILSKGSGQDKD